MCCAQKVGSIRSVCVSILIYVVSFALQSPVSLNIHNQCQGINLTSPVYFMHGGKRQAVPDRKRDVHSVMRNLLEFDFVQDLLGGALVYKIQRKHTESDKSAGNESKCIQLLIAWRIEYTKGLHVRAFLVEHDKEFGWNEDKLRRLHQKYWHVLRAWFNPTGFNWLLDNTMALKTTVKVMNGGYRWDIFISEEIKSNVEKPIWIDVER
jgi:hypothetical protein